MSERDDPLSEGIDSQGRGVSNGSSSFRVFISDAKFVSTAIGLEESGARFFSN